MLECVLCRSFTNLGCLFELLAFVQSIRDTSTGAVVSRRPRHVGAQRERGFSKYRASVVAAAATSTISDGAYGGRLAGTDTVE